MKKMLFCFLLCLSLSPQVNATDLMDIYYKALKNDTVFKHAYDIYIANAEAIPQARAALLPQINFSGQGRRNFLFADDGIFSIRKYYSSKLWEATASQALFNYEALARVRQAKASVKSAQATFNDAAQNLILRTAKAYFDSLYSQDILNFAKAQKRANKRQYEQALHRNQVGLEGITSVYEARAAYKQSKATVIASYNNQENQLENLRKLTNHVFESLAPLRDNTIPLVKPEPNNVNKWIDSGLKHNYKLFAAKYNLEIARENMKASSSGNWPVIALQTSTFQVFNNIGDPDNNPLLPKSQKQSNVALALNFPVIQGGLVVSQTRQAQFQFQATSELFEQAYREVVSNSRMAFNTIIDGINKVKADRETVVAQKSVLENTEAQYKVGNRTMVDLLNSQQRLFDAQLQLANDQYNLIHSILTLKYMAGSLNVNDLELINSWLATTRINGQLKVANTNINKKRISK